MAKPTRIQRYYLFQIAYMRWFGVLFAIAAVFITASNLPQAFRSNGPKLLVVTLAEGVALLFAGVALYRIGAAVQRRYRAHIERQIE